MISAGIIISSPMGTINKKVNKLSELIFLYTHSWSETNAVLKKIKKYFQNGAHSQKTYIFDIVLDRVRFHIIPYTNKSELGLMFLKGYDVDSKKDFFVSLEDKNSFVNVYYIYREYLL